ncbi:hypothetical protein [Stakelama tenebrarum]|uniref:Uncharacterized protein n=1 Tax=Stakelama tenebrarum TaxID=2711215 RepID=A0A6G6Y6I2_9SPHN|nr:hypothetical protein [Sphingosinithalassobacter tenebrarum]QIG80509.1 hypothetical protein G5C33_12440 [Sphingosinithalassobacter tenebrarum]
MDKTLHVETVAEIIRIAASARRSAIGLRERLARGKQKAGCGQCEDNMLHLHPLDVRPEAISGIAKWIVPLRSGY